MGRLLLLAALVLPASAQEPPAYRAASGLMPGGGGAIYFDSEGPLSYQALTPGELPAGVELLGKVKSRVCQHRFSFPLISFLRLLTGVRGDGGFGKALAQIKRRNPRLEGVYDVKVDMELTSWLTVYIRLCTEVTAKGFR